jgi:hypothetical protein
MLDVNSTGRMREGGRERETYIYRERERQRERERERKRERERESMQQLLYKGLFSWSLACMAVPFSQGLIEYSACVERGVTSYTRLHREKCY